MGGMESCCGQTQDRMEKEEDAMQKLVLITDPDDFMSRIVQDANKQVLDLKRKRTIEKI